MSWIIILADSLNIVGYFIYFLQIKRGDSEPKSVSWGLWSILSFLNFIFYRIMKDDYYAASIFFIDAVCCTIILFYKFKNKNKKKKIKILNQVDYKILPLGLISFFVWWQFKNVGYANIIICFCYIISFWPTIKEVWKDPTSENPVSWGICTFAYTLGVLNLLVEGDLNILNYLVYFVLIFLHAIVAIFAKKKEIFESPVN